MSFITSLYPVIKSKSEAPKDEDKDKKKKKMVALDDWVEKCYPICEKTKVEEKKTKHHKTTTGGDISSALDKNFIPTGEDLNMNWVIANKPKRKVVMEFLRNRVNQLLED